MARHRHLLPACLPEPCGRFSVPNHCVPVRPSCLKQAMEFFSFVGYRKWDAVTILLGIFVINNALTYLALTPRRTTSHQTDMPACLMTKPFG